MSVMTTVQSIYEFLDSFAPFDTAEEFDNVGLLLGDPDTEVKHCLIALDVTESVIDEAVEHGCNLIVSHHPVIFHPLRAVESGSLVARLIRAGISVISAHTNLDKAPGGVNDALAAALGLQDVQSFEGSDGMGRIGTLPEECEPDAFAHLVKESLSAAGVRYVGGRRPVKTVAVLGGGGEFALQAALDAGADALVTGEAKHHVLLEADAKGATFIDAGHFDTENVVCPALQQMLKEQFPEIRAMVSHCENPVRYI